ncbi:MAG: GMP synthase [Ignavibacteriae bacterium]|nr:GMP synthase [Ignavibacteriota bacterium]
MIHPVKAAIIDLYDNEPNQGMRCIMDILNATDCKVQEIPLEYKRFNTRADNELPGLDYDIYISSGGPGSPFSGEGQEWEKNYFNLLDKIMQNNDTFGAGKKFVFFICHSFQMMCRYFQLAEIVKRENRAFGIFPIFKTTQGEMDPLFGPLPNPFYGADFREWQVLYPDKKVFDDLGAKLLAIERIREKYPDKRALMAVRISPEIVGTQFHPEADPPSMYHHFRQPERKQQVVDEYDEKTYFDMIAHLENPDNISLTRETVLPEFLFNAIGSLRLEELPA